MMINHDDDDYDHLRIHQTVLAMIWEFPDALILIWSEISFFGILSQILFRKSWVKGVFQINLLSIANDVETLTRFIHVHARKFFTAGRTFHYQIHHLQVTLVPELISLMSWFFQITFKLWLAIVAMLLDIKADEIYWVAHIGSVLSSFLAALFASFLNCGSALFSAAETFPPVGRDGWTRWLRQVGRPSWCI